MEHHKWPVSMLHLTVMLVFVLDKDKCKEVIFTTGASHDWFLTVGRPVRYHWAIPLSLMRICLLGKILWIKCWLRSDYLSFGHGGAYHLISEREEIFTINSCSSFDWFYTNIVVSCQLGPRFSHNYPLSWWCITFGAFGGSGFLWLNPFSAAVSTKIVTEKCNFKKHLWRLWLKSCEQYFATESRH